MAKMEYVTPGITKIEFEDSLFVTSGLDGDENKEVKGYIESRGGVIKNSVTKTTDYLIYKDGEEETTKYKKALELIRDKGLKIRILSRSTFIRLITMNYVTPGLTKIEFEDSLFVTSGLDGDENKEVKGYIESRGGVIKNSVTKTADYLIYKDGEKETAEYLKALDLIRDKEREIRILSLSTFIRLVTMNYVTPGITKIEFEDSVFVTTGLDGDENKEVKGYIESRGGVVRDSVTETTGYLIYKDGEKETAEYLKAMELIGDREREIRVLPLGLFIAAAGGKEIMELGSYPFDVDGTKKPIRWIVLKREEKKALLLSAYGLDAKPYNEKWEDVTWETCTLRKWLNEDFFNEAFTEEEKKRILLTAVRNEDNPRYKTPGGNDTEDRVFLLSIGEAEKYLPKDVFRKKVPTPFAVKKGAYTSYRDTCWWWLRSPGYDSSCAAVVFSVGDVGNHGNYVSKSDNAGCPALWIDLKSEIECSEIDPCADGAKIHERIMKEDHPGT